MDIIESIKATKSNAIGSLVKKIQKDESLIDQIVNMTNFLDEDSSLSFRLYHIRENLSDQLRCKCCNKRIKSHYNLFCNKSCAANFNQSLREVIDKKSKSISEAYHSKTKEQKESIKKKRETTNLEKFGAKTNLILESNIQKTKSTWIGKYGTDNPNKSQTIKDKISLSNKKKSKEALLKRKNTCMGKYGVDNVFRRDATREKIRQTNIDRYGKDHPMQNEEFYEKFFNESYRKHKYKKYELPSGKIINVLGYEPQIIDLLLKKFDESDIVIGYDVFKEIKSTYRTEHKIVKYIPDIYIKSRDLVIEVKSTYTYTTVDKRKRESIIKLGHKFAYAIWDAIENKIKFKRYEIN